MRAEGSGKRIKDDPAPYIQLPVLSLAIARQRCTQASGGETDRNLCIGAVLRLMSIGRFTWVCLGVYHAFR